MIKIGLVGEDPNDTLSIKNLLEKKYSKQVQFFQLFRGTKGNHLDAPKIKKSLPIEFADKEFNFVIFIRDLDAFKSEEKKLQKRIEWFKGLNDVIDKKGILLLNIWELEALILGDFDAFKKAYNIKHKFKGDPMLQKEPKELLKRLTSKANKQFKESHCPDLFKHLDIDVIEKNCSCFKDFIQEFEIKIA
ncbi:MAG: DUF4276 family protein [Sphingobacteriales bacterium]